MKVSFYENNDFLVTELIESIENTEHQIYISIYHDGIKSIDYYLTNETNVLFMVTREIDGQSSVMTYGFSEWNIKIKEW